jgi:3',5'-cyclic AMP phosphodiesterase CpdA
MPVHLLLGNHDDRDNFLAAFPEAPRDRDGFVQQGFDTPAGRMILLDTKLPALMRGGVRGALLAGEDMADGEAPSFCSSITPTPAVGIRRMDQIPLLHAAELARVVEPPSRSYPPIFHGHLHRPLSAPGAASLSPRCGAQATRSRSTSRSDLPCPGSHEPPAYGLVLATEEGVVVHTHDSWTRRGRLRSVTDLSNTLRSRRYAGGRYPVTIPKRSLMGV